MEETSYGRRLTELAAERPDEVRVTFVAPDGSETPLRLGELESRANQIARLLIAKGVGKDDIVAGQADGLLEETNLEHVTAGILHVTRPLEEG